MYNIVRENCENDSSQVFNIYHKRICLNSKKRENNLDD